MRLTYAIGLAVGVLVVPHPSQGQTSIDGFGAVSVNQLSTLAGSSFPLDFGGRVSVDLVPGVQAVGEFGRLGNVLPEAIALPLSFLPFDVSVSAFYGEGGVRFLAAPRSAVTPYVEGTLGVAHLGYNVGGLDGLTGALAQVALNSFDRRHTMAGAGGGVLFRAGPVLIDSGYRYKQIFTGGLVGTLLSAGQDLRSHQVRVGLGVRF